MKMMIYDWSVIDEAYKIVKGKSYEDGIEILKNAGFAPKNEVKKLDGVFDTYVLRSGEDWLKYTTVKDDENRLNGDWTTNTD